MTPETSNQKPLQLSFQIFSKTTTNVGDHEYYIKIKPEEMIYLGYILESLEGWAFHTVINKVENILYISVIKDYAKDFEKLLKSIHPTLH